VRNSANKLKLRAITSNNILGYFSDISAHRMLWVNYQATVLVHNLLIRLS
jgi:hypothetical protein